MRRNNDYASRYSTFEVKKKVFKYFQNYDERNIIFFNRIQILESESFK